MDQDPLVRSTDPDPHQNCMDPQHWIGKDKVCEPREEGEDRMKGRGQKEECVCEIEK